MSFSPAANRFRWSDCRPVAAPCAPKGCVVLSSVAALLAAACPIGCMVRARTPRIPQLVGPLSSPLHGRSGKWRAQCRVRASIEGRSRGTWSKVLTSQISLSKSPEALIVTIKDSVRDSSFNAVHASAALTRLARFKRQGRLKRENINSSAWPLLKSRLRAIIRKGLPARNVASVYWGLAVLSDEPGLHFLLKLLPGLMEVTRSQLDDMIPQGLSNCLWASAKLQSVAPEVLKILPAMARHLPGKLAGMKPQELAICLWAAATVRDDSPLSRLDCVRGMELLVGKYVLSFTPSQLRQAVPAMAAAVKDQAVSFDAQALSNSFWASAKLKDRVPEVLVAVPPLAQHIARQVRWLQSASVCSCLSCVVAVV